MAAGWSLREGDPRRTRHNQEDKPPGIVPCARIARADSMASTSGRELRLSVLGARPIATSEFSTGDMYLGKVSNLEIRRHRRP
jgi:hypothetical protein